MTSLAADMLVIHLEIGASPRPVMQTFQALTSLLALKPS